MERTPPTEDGVLSAVTRLFKTLHDVVDNRVELFLLELKEERVRLFEALLLAAVVVLCALMALITVTLTVVVIFWDTHRLLVLAMLAVVYVIGAIVAFVKLRSRLLRWQSFAATREQLKKDRECFRTET